MFGRTKSTPSGSSSPSEPPAGGQAPTPAPIPRQAVGYETVLGANTTLKGDLKSKANVRIDGTLEGLIEVEGNVMVGETARITAHIHAKNEVRIAGAVRGNVFGRKVHLARTGRVWGDINAMTIVTDEGAFIDGKINMTGHPAGTQGFNALPAPEISATRPDLHGDSEPVDAEVLDEDVRSHETSDSKKV
ncbi:MAG: polymer-forming cytoskeletal protein [Anaerolinea sp.]|nr:polymer-forming cytoskeletal protein [Anaerolinea sp.]